MKKIEVVFYDSTETPTGLTWSVTRKASAEGERSDIAVLLVALGAEWEQFLPSQEDRCEHCGESHSLGDPATDEETLRAQLKLKAYMEMHYGPDASARLYQVITGGMDGGAEEFEALVESGQAKPEVKDMMEYIMAKIRTSWLSEFPDFPEEYLDEALSLTTTRLKQMLKIR